MFQGIVHTFGELLSLDPVTVSRKRMSYARFCVGVTQGVDMPKSISLTSKLGIWDQRIEFESFPFVCFHCKKAGHWAKKCPSLKAKSRRSKKMWQWKEVARDVGPLERGSKEGFALAPGASAKTLEDGSLSATLTKKVPSGSNVNGTEPRASSNGKNSSKDLSKHASDAGAQENGQSGASSDGKNSSKDLSKDAPDASTQLIGQSRIDSLVILHGHNPVDVMVHNMECLSQHPSDSLVKTLDGQDASSLIDVY